MIQKSMSWYKLIALFLMLALIFPVLTACDDDDSDVTTVTVTKTVEPTATEPIAHINAPLPTEYSMEYNYDPNLASAVSILPIINFSDIEAARAIGGGGGEAASSTPSVPGLEVVDRRISGPEGAPEVLIRIYTPENQVGLMPALLDMHPGGFVIGDIDTDHGRMAKWAKELGIIVVGVDYRLAPENPFPAGLEDCYAALVWIHDNASELAIDVNRIGVLGQSAGGGLAAALTLLSRDRGGPSISFQYLDAPELDDRLQTASMQQFVATPLWNSPNAEVSWKYYLGESILPGSNDVPPYAAPARATNLSDLPPAYILVYEFDPLRDEDILYALGLLDAGVDVELHVYPGTFHTSSLFAGAAVSQRQNQDLLDALRRGLRIE